MSRLLPLICAVALAGCGSSDVTFVTYNAGLAVGFVPGANERSAPVSQAVAGLDADVVCLQEMWLPEHVTELTGAAADAFPESHFLAPSQEVGTDPACAEGELDSLATCLDTSCADVCTDELVDCALSSCTFDFLGLEPTCMRCVQANIGDDADVIVSTCETETTEFAYDGSFGTGLVSKHPIVSTEDLVLSSTTNRRVVSHAVVDAPGGEVDVYCTHLSAVFSVIPYPRDEGSWSQEQVEQIEAALGWIDQTAMTNDVVLMGDMNNGPATADAQAEESDNYALLADGRFRNPYANQDGRCTFCPDNAISSVDSDTTGRLIDHVFIDGFGGVLAVDRVLDQAIDIETCGQTVPGALSDHYGVSVTVER